jgi:hypothetical protein
MPPAPTIVSVASLRRALAAKGGLVDLSRGRTHSDTGAMDGGHEINVDDHTVATVAAAICNTPLDVLPSSNWPKRTCNRGSREYQARPSSGEHVGVEVPNVPATDRHERLDRLGGELQGATAPDGA